MSNQSILQNFNCKIVIFRGLNLKLRTQMMGHKIIYRSCVWTICGTALRAFRSQACCKRHLQTTSRSIQLYLVFYFRPTIFHFVRHTNSNNKIIFLQFIPFTHFLADRFVLLSQTWYKLPQRLLYKPT